MNVDRMTPRLVDEDLPPHSKRCPRCGEILFDDMEVCFGCLYDFTREPYRLPEGMIEAKAATEPDDDDLPFDESGFDEQDTGILGTHSVPEEPKHPCMSSGSVINVGRKLLLRTPELVVGLSLPAHGLTLGYAPDNDVVLKLEGIAEYHLVMVPRKDDVVAVGLVENAFGSPGVPTDRGCAFLREGQSIGIGNLTLSPGLP